ncbi:MAG: GtrA family protein [Flavobacteriaceae bacterium]|nr:GtrA family protein [Flavobacteriaceae bacterium]
MIKKTLNQFTSYSLIGVMSVGIDFISYNILSFVLNIDLSTSKAISFILGSANSYLLNKSITFKSKKKSFKEIIKFIAVYTFSLIVNYIIHKYFLTITSGYTPFIVATCFSVLVNFIGQKTIVFKK